MALIALVISYTLLSAGRPRVYPAAVWSILTLLAALALRGSPITSLFPLHIVRLHRWLILKATGFGKRAEKTAVPAVKETGKIRQTRAPPEEAR